MLKEIILAIVIGGILGLGVTGSYLTMQQKNETPKKNNSVIVEPTLIPTGTDEPSADQTDDSIKITSPENNSLLSSNKTDISGIATPESNIIIATSAETFTGKSDKQGNFEIPITLESGLNIIKISSVDQENNQKDITINITYSTAKI